MGGRLFEQRNSLHNKSRLKKDININNRGITIATRYSKEEVHPLDGWMGGEEEVSSGVIEIVFL